MFAYDAEIDRDVFSCRQKMILLPPPHDLHGRHRKAGLESKLYQEKDRRVGTPGIPMSLRRSIRTKTLASSMRICYETVKPNRQGMWARTPISNGCEVFSAKQNALKPNRMACQMDQRA
jgi:hypothetical protein